MPATGRRPPTASGECADKPPKEKSIEIVIFTTPLGRTVDGREVHFQLSHGRIAYVPLMELAEKAKAYLIRRHPKISERHPAVTDTIPPEQGFRLTYTIRLRQPTTYEVRERAVSGRRSKTASS